MRAIAALLLALLAGCGAGLEEPDPRPKLDVKGACVQQPDGICDGPKAGG